MKQENKQLLLKDLCARLPYGVKVKIKHYDDAWELLAIYTNGTTYATRDVGYPIETYFEDCKPYLFPLSSMTEEQKEEIEDKLIFPSNSNGGWIEILSNDKYKIPSWFFDFCNKNHFDYRGLIPKNLANDATGKGIY